MIDRCRRSLRRFRGEFPYVDSNADPEAGTIRVVAKNGVALASIPPVWDGYPVERHAEGKLSEAELIRAHGESAVSAVRSLDTMLDQQRKRLVDVVDAYLVHNQHEATREDIHVRDLLVLEMRKLVDQIHRLEGKNGSNTEV